MPYATHSTDLYAVEKENIEGIKHDAVMAAGGQIRQEFAEVDCAYFVVRRNELSPATSR